MIIKESKVEKSNIIEVKSNHKRNYRIHQITIKELFILKIFARSKSPL